MAWGVANAMVAQVATRRLLFAMARDRQLPAFLAKVSLATQVPVNAVLVSGVAVPGRGRCAWRAAADGITVLLSLVNFGAVPAFLLLHCRRDLALPGPPAQPELLRASGRAAARRAVLLVAVAVQRQRRRPAGRPRTGSGRPRWCWSACH